MATNGHLLVLTSTHSFRGISTIQATSRLLVTLRHMSANKRTGAPRWKEQLDAALENEEKGDNNLHFEHHDSIY